MLRQLKTTVSQLGGTIAQKYTASVTHIVSTVNTDKLAKRTIKYFYGVVAGKWLLSFDWIIACLKEERWVDERDYEIKGDLVFLGGPEKGRLRIENNIEGIFVGLNLYIYGNFSSPSKEDLQSLVEIGGAVILTKPPIPTMDNLNTFILCDPEISEKESKLIFKSHGLIPISYQWILDSISKYELINVSDYEIFRAANTIEDSEDSIQTIEETQFS